MCGIYLFMLALQLVSNKCKFSCQNVWKCALSAEVWLCGALERFLSGFVGLELHFHSLYVVFEWVCMCTLSVNVQLQLENEQLYDELNSMVDEVR